MSVSRCLGPAIQRLFLLPRQSWKAEIEKLPEVCPHRDCTAGGCRELVAEYFRTQWHIAARKEEIKRRGGHAQG